jgi:hypothetical protein
MSRGNQSLPLPEFHPQTVIREWDNGDAFRLSDALTGVCVFGATGSGKTSGPAKHLAYGYLANQFGGLVLCAKKEERHQWEQWAAETGRTDDLVIVDAGGTWRFNPLAWESARPEEGGGFTINVVSLLDEIATAVAGETKPAGGDQKFWENALHNLNCNLVDLPLLAGVEVSLPLLRSISSTAAHSRNQLDDPRWQEDSVCAAMLREADKTTAQGDAKMRSDFEECHTYWTQDYPSLGETTRGSILLGFTILVRPLVTRPLKTLFSSDTNIKPEDTFDGKIIIIDLPVQEFRLAGRIANLIWKHCFQLAVMRRTPPASGETFLRPVFLWVDEAQNFITKSDAEYQAVARSAGGCTVYLTQNRESFRRVLGNDDAVDSLLGNLQAKFFCQNTGHTSEWAANLLGERWIHITSTNVGRSHGENVQRPNESTHNANVTRAEQRRYFVEPSRFTTLKRGGPLHGFHVECIVYLGGHLFQNGNESLPYRLLTFNQK